jgi:hypothetical protein
MIQTKAVIHVDDVLNNVVDQEGPAHKLGGARTMLCVPMLKEESCLEASWPTVRTLARSTANR